MAPPAPHSPLSPASQEAPGSSPIPAGSRALTVFTQYSEAHRILFEEWFRPSLPPGAELVVNRLSAKGPGHFGSPEWQECLTDKLRFLAEQSRVRPGQTLVWADADVQFFAGFDWAALKALHAASGRDFLFQKESRPERSREVNTGFFIFRGGPESAAFFERAHAHQLGAERNDQLTINTLLSQGGGPGWDFLPLTYYARSQGFPPGRGLLLHHANYTHTGGVEVKVRQLRQIRRMMTGGPAGYLAGCLQELAARSHRIPHKLASFLRRT